MMVDSGVNRGLYSLRVVNLVVKYGVEIWDRYLVDGLEHELYFSIQLGIRLPTCNRLGVFFPTEWKM